MTKLVQKFPHPNLIGLTMAKKRSIKINGDTAKWDVIHNSRHMAPLTVAGAEAVPTGLMAKEKKTSTMAYTRVKKSLKASTLYWLRQPGTENTQEGEQAVRRELNDLDFQVDQRNEWLFWQMHQGALAYNENGVNIGIDYGLAASHKPTAAVLWSDTANADPLANLEAWCKEIEEDGGVVPDKIYLHRTAMGYLKNNVKVQAMLKNLFKSSDGITSRVRELVLADLGLEIIVYSAGYVPEGGSFTPHIPSNKVIITAGDEYYDYQEGASDDLDAKGLPGKFSKSWQPPDPSSRQILIEHHRLPVLTQVEQLACATIA